MRREVLNIRVLCTGTESVTGCGAEVNMVLFEGTAEGPDFKGAVLPGGCDTQKRQDERVALSARYMLRGRDREGVACSVFVENNGVIDLTAPSPVTSTIPRIVTDSAALRWLETAELSGEVSGDSEGHVWVRIFAEVEP